MRRIELLVSSLVLALLTGGCASGTQGAPEKHECAPPPASSFTASVKTYGATGDGVTDDTAAIQAAIDAVGGTGGTLLVPDGVYMINAVVAGSKGLVLRSDMTLRLSPGAVLKALANGSDGYAILYLPAVKNVTITGGALEGDRGAHTAATGESGMGILIASSERVCVAGITARECWGDGFYVGGATGCRDITFCHVVADHNRRQGLSVVKADGVLVRHSTFKNTQGTLPECGIDIEPNAGETVANMRIQDCAFLNNSGSGIQNGVALANTGSSYVRDVVIEGNVITGNGFGAAGGGPGGGGIEISNTAGHRVVDNAIRDNNNWGVRLRDNADGTVVSGNVVSGTKKDGIYVDPTIAGYVITDNTVTDNARYGIYLGSGSSGTLSGNTQSGNGM